MQGRYYDPVVGRFMGVDSVGVNEADPRTFNRYAYANNNPYLYIDPDGKIAAPAIWAVGFFLTVGDMLSNDPVPGHEQDGIASVATLPGPIRLGGKVAAEAFERGTSVVTKKPVVIGENMKDSVIPAAKKRGADYYKPRKTKGDPLKKNERWIDDKMREGRKIIDIGPDPRRSKRSPFYEAEKRRIERRNYPVTK
jgi:uncharacterized protein RhaS with RHS repeats